MKKQRKYLKDLIPVKVNKLVLYDGSFEFQFDGNTLSLVPETYGKWCFLAVFINNQRQPMQWELSARPHVGRLANGAVIGYRYDQVYYVVSGSRRYRHLFIDPETMTIGVRTDFFPDHNRAYPRGKEREGNGISREQVKAQYEELFGEKDEFMREFKKREKLSRFGL